jgi:hypothetical protein
VKNPTQHFETDVAVPADGEFVIVLDPSRRRDEHGRVQFTTFWFDPKTPGEGGPPDHLRGQVSHADPEQHARDLYRHGATVVRVIDHKPTWHTN